MKTSTIAAISTPLGTGGIGIVRMSGPEAFVIARKLFKPYGNKRIESLPGYSGCLGVVEDADENTVDEAILFVYRAPRSYTGEDVVELSCHGGLWLVRRVLRLCLDGGAILAGPGEFTRRAFLNGKLDLLQAEAVMDLIRAQGDSAARAAMENRAGKLSAAIKKIEEDLLEQSSHLAAWADYPDEDMDSVEAGALSAALAECRERVKSVLSTFDLGKILREGVTVAIVGKPNVGKSTLMNLIAGQQRSIVTDLPGTTRDVIEETVRLGDMVLRLYDTAGIRGTEDMIEKIGVERSKELLASTQLVLALFDGSRELEEHDLNLLALLRDKPVIGVVNKIDLDQRLDLTAITSGLDTVVAVSASTGEGLDRLEKEIRRVLEMDKFDPSQAVIVNERQRMALQEAYSSLENAVGALADGVTLDAVGVEIDYALDALLSLTGRRASERVVEEVFSRFCVGK